MKFSVAFIKQKFRDAGNALTDAAGRLAAVRETPSAEDEAAARRLEELKRKLDADAPAGRKP